MPDPALFQNFQDTEAEKAIMGSIVYCIHHKDGCKWSDELRKLKVIIEIAVIKPDDIGMYRNKSSECKFLIRRT